MPTRGLLERLNNKENIIVAEGYLFEFERRGYLKAGAFVPEVVLEHPELVKSLHEEFVHSGSEVVLAFTYYGHREKMKKIGRESDLEKLNLTALRIARKVADETGTLMAGNICNTWVYDKDDPTTHAYVTSMFKEQVEWAVAEGADFIVGESFETHGEANLALEAIKAYGNGLPAVITLLGGNSNNTLDGVPMSEAARRLEESGAAVVGINCCRGPKTIMPIIKDIRKVCNGPIAAMPVPYRTSEECPTFQSLKDQETGALSFPKDLSSWLCNRTQISRFAQEARELGVQYVGLCCGNAAHYIRCVAEEYGRSPPSCKYSPDVTQHPIFGDDPNFGNERTKVMRDYVA